MRVVSDVPISLTCAARLANNNWRLFFSKHLGVLALTVARFVMGIYWKPLPYQLIVVVVVIAYLRMPFVIIQ